MDIVQGGILGQPYGCVSYEGEWLVPEAVCKKRRYHAGIDIPAQRGRDVLATRSGIVVAVGIPYLGPYAVGIYSDEGVFMLYGHLDAAWVKVGQRVKVKQKVGILGSQGQSTGPHLHLEIRIDGAIQGGNKDGSLAVWALRDPLDYLSFKETDYQHKGTPIGAII